MNISVSGNVEIRTYSNLGVLKKIENISNTITQNLAKGLIEKILYSTSTINTTPRYIVRANTRGDYDMRNSSDYKEPIKSAESNDIGEVIKNGSEIGRSASFRFMIPSQSWVGEEIVSIGILSSDGKLLAIINLDKPIQKSSDNYFDIRWNFNVIKGGD